jgi:hypothetical protein
LIDNPDFCFYIRDDSSFHIHVDLEKKEAAVQTSDDLNLTDEQRKERIDRDVAFVTSGKYFEHTFRSTSTLYSRYENYDR